MNTRARLSFGPTLVAIACGLLAAPAHGQMTPLQDLREVNAAAHYQGLSESFNYYPSAPFAYFEEIHSAFVSNDYGSSTSDVFQISQFYPAGMSASGGTSGTWQGDPSGSYNAHSLFYLRVRMDTCVQYSFYTQIDPGDVGSGGHVEVRAASAGPAYLHFEAGEHSLDGRLPAGEYVFEARSSIATSLEYMQGPVYSLIWTCQPCSAPLITQHPVGVLVPCGSPAQFSVTPSGSPGAYTYQWRKNLVPLANGGKVSGATSPTLNLTNVCHADTGYYDVVVSSGQISEPSKLARLGITSTTGVDPLARPAVLALHAAVPNPFSGSTTLRYEAGSAVQAQAAIFDASGRLVRRLAEGEFSGAGALTWDGRTDAGHPARAGLYFLRLSGAGETHVRRLALAR